MIFFILQVAPGPPGGVSNELVWQQNALNVYNVMVARGYTQLAAEWKAFYPGYHISHPQLSVQQVESAFAGQLLASGLAAGIPGATSILGGIPGAAAKGAENAIATITNPLDFLKYPADFFYRLTQPSTWIRVGEFIVGAMLIYVGIKAVATPGGATGAAKSGVRTGKKTGSAVGRVAGAVTPTGRAARVISKHERRVKAGQTRQRAEVIRGKQKEFGRKELYR